MPELPEVETMRRGILPLVGAKVLDIDRPPCRKRPISIKPRIDQVRRRLVGQKITAIERLGKRVILRFASQDALVIEPRMTGLVLLADPPTTEHLRLRIKVSGVKPKQMLFWDRRGLGTVQLLSAEELADKLGDKTLGPDALAVTAAILAERLAASARAIKVALLDQRAVAGIGNLYASEILHLAAIDPRRACKAITKREWTRIEAATIEVLELAVKYEGSTLGDGTYRNALNKEGGYQNHHRVYARHGELCPTCGKLEIVRIVQAQRATFFCARCQK